MKDDAAFDKWMEEYDLKKKREALARPTASSAPGRRVLSREQTLKAMRERGEVE